MTKEQARTFVGLVRDAALGSQRKASDLADFLLTLDVAELHPGWSGEPSSMGPAFFRAVANALDDPEVWYYGRVVPYRGPMTASQLRDLFDVPASDNLYMENPGLDILLDDPDQVVDPAGRAFYRCPRKIG
jgi:hypothetical protein